MDHTVYLQITPCLPFLRERSPDGTTTATKAASRHPIAAYYSFIDPERMKGEERQGRGSKLKAKFHYAILVAVRSEASRRPAAS